MPVGDIHLTALHFTLQGNANMFCNYFQTDEEPDAAAVISDLSTYIVDDWENDMRSIMDDTFVVDCVEVRQVHPNNSIPNIEAVSNPAGSRTAAEAYPGQCSLVATLFGDKDNPDGNNRGRDFWTGAQEGDQGDGAWKTTTGKFLFLVTAYYDNRTVLVEPASGNVFSWGTFSRKRAAVPSVPFFYQMELVRLRHLVRTQRRRQPTDPCELFNTATPVQP